VIDNVTSFTFLAGAIKLTWVSTATLNTSHISWAINTALAFTYFDKKLYKKPKLRQVSQRGTHANAVKNISKISNLLHAFFFFVIYK